MTLGAQAQPPANFAGQKDGDGANKKNRQEKIIENVCHGTT
jgi:hypothetical protein